MKNNELKLNSNNVVQQKKFYNLLMEKCSSRDQEKVIFNFSKYVISDTKKLLFSNGLIFSVLYKMLDYVDYLVYFELFLETFFLMKIRIFLK